MKEKQKLDPSEDPRYFDASVIERDHHIPKTHQCEWHVTSSQKALILSLIYAISHLRDARESPIPSDPEDQIKRQEVIEAWELIKILISNEMIRRASNGPLYLRKKALSCKHRSSGW